MRVIALVESEDHVCCRYRVQAFVPGLSKSGIDVQIMRLEHGWKRWILPESLRLADVVVLQRRLLPGWELIRLRRSVKRLVFDFDDAVFLRDSYHQRGMVSARLRQRFRATIRLADAVVAGNDWLAERARENGANVTVIPTCVEPRLYSIAEHDRHNGLTLAWIGSASTLQGLEQARSLLEHLGQTIPGLRLRLIADRGLSLQNMPVDFIRWSPEMEASTLASADVGISVLPDDDWSRGKCGLKVLQYMAAGLPVVGNTVGVTPRLIASAGILADSPKQWHSALQRLHDPELRHRLGSAGRRLVEAEYCVDVGVHRWTCLLSNLTALRRAG